MYSIQYSEPIAGHFGLFSTPLSCFPSTLYYGWEKASNVQTFKFSLRSFTAMPTLMFAHVHVWLIIWACSSKVKAVLLAASVSFLSPAMLNLTRNSNRNKTSTRYKAIIQFWRLSLANQGDRNIDKKLLKTRANF